MDEQAEELKRLRRQYRIMNKEKQSLKSVHVVSADGRRKWLETLRQQFDGLQMAASAAQRNRCDRKLVKQLKCIIDDITSLDERLQTQSESLSALDGEIRKVGARRLEIKQRGHSPQDGGARYENQISTLSTAYSRILCDNRALRACVESLLRDRQLFNARYRQHIATLQMGERHLLDAVDGARAVYAQRDDCLAKLRALRAKSASVERTHAEEMSVTRRRLHAHAQLADFVAGKCAPRARTHRAPQRSATDREMAQRRDEWSAARRTLDAIRRFADDDDDVIDAYVRREHENFALFNYVNTLSAEIDALTDGSERLHAQIAHLHAGNRVAIEATADDLRMQREMAVQAVAASNARLRTMEDEMQAIAIELERMFNLLQCEGEPIACLIGANKCEITAQNVLAHLEIFDGKLARLVDF